MTPPPGSGLASPSTEENDMANLDIVICPGCGSELPVRNRGCDDCGYEDSEVGRIQTLSEILQQPSYPARGAARFNDVSPAFLAALVKAAGGELPQAN